MIPRIFRPTYLAVFGIDNFELGTYFSVYGIVAIGAYLLGGPLADRYPAHKLMSAALASTALGGLYMATIPAIDGMFALYAFWGLTTILLFWAAMIRATRIVGGVTSQGIAFGLLDGGRGLVAAIVGSLGVALLSYLLPDDLATVSTADRDAAFRTIIYFFTAFVFLAALMIYFSLKRMDESYADTYQPIRWAHILKVMRMPAVMLQAIIILCAYSGYRAADNLSLVAQDVLGYDEVASASVGSLVLWIRPLAAIAAGLLADRSSSSRMTQVCFALLITAGLTMGFAPLDYFTGAIVFFTIISTGLGVYALRGLYFAIMQEAQIPLYFTGTAVGIASIIGYLPDIYMAPLTGYLIDEFPGVEGHRYVFLLMAGFALIGLLAAGRFRRIRAAGGFNLQASHT